MPDATKREEARVQHPNEAANLRNAKTCGKEAKSCLEEQVRYSPEAEIEKFGAFLKFVDFLEYFCAMIVDRGQTERFRNFQV